MPTVTTRLEGVEASSDAAVTAAPPKSTVASLVNLVTTLYAVKEAKAGIRIRYQGSGISCPDPFSQAVSHLATQGPDAKRPTASNSILGVAVPNKWALCVEWMNAAARIVNPGAGNVHKTVG